MIQDRTKLSMIKRYPLIVAALSSLLLLLPPLLCLCFSLFFEGVVMSLYRRERERERVPTAGRFLFASFDCFNL